MKIIFVLIFIVSSLLSDEMGRIENIVSDISKLRVDYEECSKQLKLKNENVVSFNAAKNSNDSTITKIEKSLKDKTKENVILENKIIFLNSVKDDISTLKLKVEELEKTLKTKEEIINSLKAENLAIFTIKENENISLKNRIKEIESKTLHVRHKKIVCKPNKEENIFPQLVMKEASIQKVPTPEESKITEAYTYKLKVDTTIYDGVNGQKLHEWNKKSTFTSNETTQNWVKITGYFVDMKWRPSEKEMWIKKVEVLKNR